MSKTILVTGGAGFIGSHLCERLLADGYRVRVLDDLCPQVHGPRARGLQGRSARHATDLVPDLPAEVELIVGDVRDGVTCRRALLGVDGVVHLAARVGVGQSMYEVAEYTAVNSLGTATLVQALIERPIERLVVASSMSIYGEGSYVDADGVSRIGRARSVEQLRRHEWEVMDDAGRPLRPVPTNESKPPSLASVYALSKLDQEQLCLTVGQAYGIEAVALRLFNVYGPRQALSNPYTGVMAIFSSRMLLGRPPLINEDGRQRRDFVNVHDVVDAFMLALEQPGVAGRAYNIASGKSVTIEEVARRLGQVLDRPNVEPVLTGAYRAGDIRHCCADISLAKKVLGFAPQVTLEKGLNELAVWLAEGHMPEDNVERAREELSRRGLAL